MDSNLSNILKATALLNSSKEDEPKVTNELRTAWNAYTLWLDKKGMKGHPDLDKDQLGFKMLELYRKENPSTPLTKEAIPIIQKDFSNYRNWSLNQIKQGKGQFAEGVNEKNYLAHLSKIDGYPGKLTTSVVFPSDYLKTFDVNNKLLSTENKGLVRY